MSVDVLNDGEGGANDKRGHSTGKENGTVHAEETSAAGRAVDAVAPIDKADLLKKRRRRTANGNGRKSTEGITEAVDEAMDASEAVEAKHAELEVLTNGEHGRRAGEGATESPEPEDHKPANGAMARSHEMDELESESEEKPQDALEGAETAPLRRQVRTTTRTLTTSSDQKPPEQPASALPTAQQPGSKRATGKPTKGKARRGPKTETTTLYPQGLAPVKATVDNHWLYVYFRFCSERHRMQVKRELGVSKQECTEDETMLKTVVGNVFRELDRGSLRMTDTIMANGDQSHEEICFRVFLFCGFYKEATWDALAEGLGEIPNWNHFNRDFEKYERILHQRSFVRREVIYTSGFQLVPPTIYFGRNLPHYAATLRFVKALMDMGLPERLLGCKYAVDASLILQTIPTFGGFLSWNILNYLNCSRHLHFGFRNYASCGPGSREYLRRIFGKETINSVPMELAGLQWLYDNQWRYWARIGVDPPHYWQNDGQRPGMRVVDIENSLCWCKRYTNDYASKGYRSVADLGDPVYPPEADQASMPAWCEEERAVGSVASAVFDDDYEEARVRLAADKDGLYEVERIVCRKGSRSDADGLFRVRWKGYTPEHDTWERASSLKDGAGEVLQDWLDWEEEVWSTIEGITKDMPWSEPEPEGPEVKKELEEVEDEEAISRRPLSKRKTPVVGAGDMEAAVETAQPVKRSKRLSARVSSTLTPSHQVKVAA